MLKVDSKVVSYQIRKGRVLLENVNHFPWSKRTYRRWNTKRFQKRRNLPQQSRRILKAWIDDHIDAPHPTDSEKKLSLKQQESQFEQVSNWFVNARVRYVQTTESFTRYVTTLKSRI